MYFCLAFKNTGICSVLCISGPKSIGIYSIFCVFAWLPPTTLKRKNVVIYSILWLPKSEKSSEKCVKTVFFSDFWDLQNASSNFTLFLSTPDPEKRENPTRLKDFWGGSAAGARPRVAKAMLSFPTHTARRRRIFELTLIVGSAGPLGPPFHRSVGVKVTEWGPASEIYSLGFLEHICWNRQFFGEQVSSRKLLRRVFPKELLPISTCYFV